MAYYTAVPNGGSYLGATIHDSADCAAAPEVVRPVGKASVDGHADEVDWCSSCFDGDGDDADICQVIKNDGEVCGRDLPCPYHS